jgi:hypothetical protein
MDSLVSLFRAAYRRLGGTDALAVIAALLDKPQNDVLVRALGIIFYIARTDPTISAADLLDLAIAQSADIESTTADIDPQMKQLADYLVTSLSQLPQPIPRTLLQSLGVALAKSDSYPNRQAAVQYLLDTYDFE